MITCGPGSTLTGCRGKVTRGRGVAEVLGVTSWAVDVVVDVVLSLTLKVVFLKVAWLANKNRS